MGYCCVLRRLWKDIDCNLVGYCGNWRVVLSCDLWFPVLELNN